MLNFLPINKENIKKTPDIFSLTLEKTIYIFKVSYLEKEDSFYFDMLDKAGNSIIRGRKITYGNNLLNRVALAELKNIKLVAYSKYIENEKTGINYNNFYDSVFVYVIIND